MTRLALLISTLVAALGLVAGASSATPTEPQIVFATGTIGPQARNADIYVRDADGSVRRLTKTPWYEGSPSWSPDRTRLVYVSARSGDADIYVMNADGTGQRRLAGSKKGPQDQYPAWSPDGKLIAFASNRHGEEDIYVMRSDGTGLRQLTKNAVWIEDQQPRFSPDGRFIVFSSNRVAFSNPELYRLRVSDGRGLVRLTHWGSGGDLSPGDDLMGDYSPDGKRIAFVSDRSGSYAVWTMNANGTGLRRLIAHRGKNVAFPRWSPDGTTLLYTSFDASGRKSDFRLHAIGADGSNPRVLRAGTEADW
jgi:TolB protein